MNRSSIDVCEECVSSYDCHNVSCEFFAVADNVDENERKTMEFFFLLHLPKQEDTLDAICNAEELNELNRRTKEKVHEEVILDFISFPKREGMGRRFCCDKRVLRTI